MVDDFLNDYNTYFKTTYTRENLPLGAWVLNNFHTFLYDEKYHDKWRWMPAYLAVVGSNTNRRACADFATVSTAAAFNAINSNHIYAFSYEIRGLSSTLNTRKTPTGCQAIILSTNLATGSGRRLWNIGK